MLENLNEIQMSNILLSQSVGRIACTDGIRPYIVPVTYVYDGKNIIGQTNEGMKLDIMRKNPNVCFEVDIINNTGCGESVVVTGIFHELDGDSYQEKREYLLDHVWPLSTGQIVHSHEHKMIYELDDSNRIKTVIYCIEILEKTGRFITQ
jgi:nitroimidazol reductase NimA-like FMN-containing flavoprotein (pyridoxamine 5'-phosphate oxidase superfamily)